MLKMMVAMVAACLGACAEEDVPSCQVAVTSFYGAGCAFQDLATAPPTPYTLNESILSCKEVNSAVPDRCQGYFDDYMFCLDGVASTAQCTACSDEQDALFGCD